jgi:hypothetical protein
MSNLTRFICLTVFAVSPLLAQDCDCNTGVSRPYGMAYGQPVSYASAPMISAPMMTAGAVGCMPVTQCVTVPMQCQTVAIQPRYEERTVERTVMVPKLVNEKRKVREVQYKSVQRERDVTVYETRPRVRNVKQRRQVMEPVTRTKTEYYSVMKPVVENVRREVTVSVPETVRRQAFRTEYRPQYRTVKEDYTEMVPVRERHTATRRVARSVPVTSSRTVMQDAGYWATQQVAVQRPMAQTVAATTVGAATGIGGACGACVPVSCGCQTDYMTRRVYVPRQVAMQQQCTSMRQEMVEVPYEYEKVTYRPVTRQRTVRQERLQQVRVPYDYEEVVYRDRKEFRTEQVERMVEQKRQRTIRFTEMVPRTKVENVRVTEYEEVPVKKRETYTALVPREIEREVTVQVYKDTPRKVTETVRVPVSGGTVIR